MLRRITFFFFTFYSAFSFLCAQCPVSVGITSSPNVSVSICKGTSVELTANPSAGVISPQYIWIVDGDTVLGVDTTISIIADTQFVELVMFTSNGCPSDSAYASIQISTVTITSSVDVVRSSCDGTMADIQITSSGGTAPYQYDIQGIGMNNTGAYNDLPIGNYPVIITDSMGCIDTNEITVMASITIITSSVNPLVTTCNQSQADIQITAEGGTSPYNYDLSEIGQNSSGLFTGVEAKDYVLTIQDDNGCEEIDSITISPFECPDPDFHLVAITPNGDGINDTWTIENLEFYPKNEMFIYDRWGQRVYYKKDYKNDDAWDGEYLGVILPVSSYFYIFKVELALGEEKTYRGAVSIFK